MWGLLFATANNSTDGASVVIRGGRGFLATTTAAHTRPNASKTMSSWTPHRYAASAAPAVAAAPMFFTDDRVSPHNACAITAMITGRTP